MVALAHTVHQVDGYPYWLPGSMRDFLAPPDALGAWVAEADGEVVGHVALHPSTSQDAIDFVVARTGWSAADLGVIARLLVAPHARGRGLGRALLTTATDTATSLGRHAVLDVATEYAPAITLYESCGWHRLGTVHVHLPDVGSLDEHLYVAGPLRRTEPLPR